MLKTKPTPDQLWQWHCASLDLPEPYEASQLIANQAYAAGASSRDDEIETLRYELDAIAGVINAERDGARDEIARLTDLVEYLVCRFEPQELEEMISHWKQSQRRSHE